MFSPTASTTTTVEQLLQSGRWPSNNESHSLAFNTSGAPTLPVNWSDPTSLLPMNVPIELSLAIERQLTRHWITDRWLQILLLSVYWSMTLLAICSNTSILLVVACRRRLWTPSVLLSSNLLLASLASALLCMPLTLQSLVSRRWTLGWFGCKLLPFLQSVCVFVSSFTVVSISADRYLRITWLRRTASVGRAPKSTVKPDGASHTNSLAQSSSATDTGDATLLATRSTSKTSTPLISTTNADFIATTITGAGRAARNCAIVPARSVRAQLINTALVWLLSALFSAPVLVYQELTTVGVLHVFTYNACLERWPDHIRILYTLATFVCAFAVPICALCCFHLAIRRYLNQNLLSAQLLPPSTRVKHSKRTETVSPKVPSRHSSLSVNHDAQSKKRSATNEPAVRPASLSPVEMTTSNNAPSTNFTIDHSNRSSHQSIARDKSIEPFDRSQPIELTPMVTVCLSPPDRPRYADFTNEFASHHLMRVNDAPRSWRAQSPQLSSLNCIEMNRLETYRSFDSLCASLSAPRCFCSNDDDRLYCSSTSSTGNHGFRLLNRSFGRSRSSIRRFSASPFVNVQTGTSNRTEPCISSSSSVAVLPHSDRSSSSRIIEAKCGHVLMMDNGFEPSVSLAPTGPVIASINRVEPLQHERQPSIVDDRQCTGLRCDDDDNEPVALLHSCHVSHPLRRCWSDSLVWLETPQILHSDSIGTGSDAFPRPTNHLSIDRSPSHILATDFSLLDDQTNEDCTTRHERPTNPSCLNQWHAYRSHSHQRHLLLHHSHPYHRPHHHHHHHHHHHPLHLHTSPAVHRLNSSSNQHLVDARVSFRITGFMARLRRIQRLHRELRRTSKVTLVLILAIVVFAISWLPLSLYNLYLDLQHVHVQLSVQMLYVILFACHLLAMSSTVSNAVLYGFLNTNIQRELRQVFSAAKSFCCARLSFHRSRTKVPIGSSNLTGFAPTSR
jgi:hypothetical protein